ncbi:uncharacterized protein LOC128234412 isoform X2 [Mya arenaria]|uniref:uncharacterized protein LOC128234412 isoform X2 n=1 Tax=Mya arenaria TaxID=6604 RepID=UPI0022E4E67B|nr:uncharacterized protein LOC128234412 isoform X2 [Mya arenaria]
MGSGCHGTLVGQRKLGGNRLAGSTQVTLLAVGYILLVSLAQTSGFQDKMWTDAHNACRTTNTTLPEMYLGSTPKERIRLVGSTGPLWLMGFEVFGRLNNEGRLHGVLYLNSTDTANVLCGIDGKGKTTYAVAQSLCSDKAPMLSVTAYNISHTALERDQYNSSLWIDTIDPGEFINADGTDVQILCYILTESGEIQTDNCTNSHPFQCVNGSLAPVVRYFGKTSPFNRYSSGTHTTHGGTSGTPRTSTSRANLMDQDLLITLFCTGAAVILAVVVAVCCCCCRQNRHGKSGSPSLADNYSETADSVTFNALKSSEASEYATPSDALGGGGPKTARPRSSLIEGEYDVLQQGNAQTDKPKRKVAIVNAYNHVIIVPPNQDRASGSKECENEYDVSTLHKQTNIVVDPEKGSGNVYGHVDIR